MGPVQDGSKTVGFLAQKLWDRAQKLWDLTAGESRGEDGGGGARGDADQEPQGHGARDAWTRPTQTTAPDDSDIPF